MTLAVSNSLSAQYFNQLLENFATRFPHIELDIITAEDEDIISLIKSGRAIIGICNAATRLPLTMKGQTLAIHTTMCAWIAASHPLAGFKEIAAEDLINLRKLTLKTLNVPEKRPSVTGFQWTANCYLLLIDMVQEGYGWSILPDWMVHRFSTNLQPLPMVGLPRQVNLQLIYSALRPFGPAAQWVMRVLNEL